MILLEVEVVVDDRLEGYPDLGFLHLRRRTGSKKSG